MVGPALFRLGGHENKVRCKTVSGGNGWGQPTDANGCGG